MSRTFAFHLGLFLFRRHASRLAWLFPIPPSPASPALPLFAFASLLFNNSLVRQSPWDLAFSCRVSPSPPSFTSISTSSSPSVFCPPPPLHNHPPHPSHPSGRRSLLWSPVAARPARLTCRPPLHSLAAPRLLPRLQPTLDPASPPGACLDLLHFLCLGGVASNDVAD